MVTPLWPVELSGAVVRVRGLDIIGPVDLTLAEGRLTVLMGPNGAGKTTLLRLIHGLARPSAGTVRYGCGRVEALRRQAFVFQSPVVLRRSVLDNLAYPLRLRDMPRQEALEMATDWGRQVGLGALLDHRATTLSGGEKQKLALARALITGPDLLLLDEPTANLDGRSKKAIEAMLLDAARAGTRVLIATHDLPEARRLADDVIFMARGRIYEHAPADQFFMAPDTPDARAYLNGDILE